MYFTGPWDAMNLKPKYLNGRYRNFVDPRQHKQPFYPCPVHHHRQSKMTEESPSKASAFFIDRLVQPLLGGLNPSFAPVSENGKPGLSLNLMTRNFRRFSAR